MATPYKKSAPKPAAKSDLVLSPRSDKRSFDARPKPSDYTRRDDPRDRAIRPTEAPDGGLDPDPGE